MRHRTAVTIVGMGQHDVTSGREVELVDALTQRLGAEPDVQVAYVFGSQARGTAGPLSDVDVAVLLDEDASVARATGDRELMLRDAVAETAGTSRVDVVVLNHAPPSLAYRVLAHGKLLLSRDERRRVQHWVHTVDRYLDMAPLREVFDAGLRQRLREGRFGRS